MKPGDLVLLTFAGDLHWNRRMGMIVKESDRTNEWGEEVNRWWWVFVVGVGVMEEVEKYLEEVL